MSTFYMPSGKDDKGHICDMCELENGQPTLYWKSHDFDICLDCLRKLYFRNVAELSNEPQVAISRIVVTEELRNRIFKRDDYQCKKCGTTENLSIDHIMPFSKGGITEESNLQTLCRSCNSRKGAR